VNAPRILNDVKKQTLYLIESDGYESVHAGSNGKAEIAHLRQLLLRMQEHLYRIR